jgi:hypothetical protein
MIMTRGESQKSGDGTWEGNKKANGYRGQNSMKQTPPLMRDDEQFEQSNTNSA